MTLSIRGSAGGRGRAYFVDDVPDRLENLLRPVARKVMVSGRKDALLTASREAGELFLR